MLFTTVLSIIRKNMQVMTIDADSISVPQILEKITELEPDVEVVTPLDKISRLLSLWCSRDYISQDEKPGEREKIKQAFKEYVAGALYVTPDFYAQDMHSLLFEHGVDLKDYPVKDVYVSHLGLPNLICTGGFIRANDDTAVVLGQLLSDGTIIMRRYAKQVDDEQDIAHQYVNLIYQLLGYTEFGALYPAIMLSVISSNQLHGVELVPERFHPVLDKNYFDPKSNLFFSVSFTLPLNNYALTSSVTVSDTTINLRLDESGEYYKLDVRLHEDVNADELHASWHEDLLCKINRLIESYHHACLVEQATNNPPTIINNQHHDPATRYILEEVGQDSAKPNMERLNIIMNGLNVNANPFTDTAVYLSTTTIN